MDAKNSVIDYEATQRLPIANPLARAQPLLKLEDRGHEMILPERAPERKKPMRTLCNCRQGRDPCTCRS